MGYFYYLEDVALKMLIHQLKMNLSIGNLMRRITIKSNRILNFNNMYAILSYCSRFIQVSDKK